MLEKIISYLNDALYGYILIILLILAGLYFTLRTKFVQFRIPVIIYLGKYAIRALNDYTEQRKLGKDPVFYAKNIGLPHEVDYWKE